MLKRVAALLFLISIASATEAFAQTCKAPAAVSRLSALPEASGLAASRATPGRLWSHNDSGKPELVALDATGNVVTRVAVAGASVEDWEAIASAPCGNSTCLYIADIGDNDAKRKHIVVYRLTEPAGGTARVDAVYRASYPDGAHDAETLIAGADGSLSIVTKGETGPIAVYRFPRELKTNAIMALERVGAPISKVKAAADARVTDGARSPDGKWVVLRTAKGLQFYRAQDFDRGVWNVAQRIDLSSLSEPQGEAVAFGANGAVYVGGEGGGKSQPGTLAVIACSL